ncbi:hypothetical protein [Glycomyces arizonensis]|uniref:hypothetical protein n=1 Tax=Glycomyces arizonensis TaxID=256035 RepID=UPI0003F81135|nr:hypothetical protein [Glycomyces arizonensis]
MGYQQEWVDDFDEGSEFDLAGSADDDGEGEDPEAVAAGEEGATLEEVNPADAAEQGVEVPGEEDEEPHAG